VVAAKPLLATALIALCFTGAALGDNPTVRIVAADQARAVASLLRLSDLGSGWQGGMTKPTPLVSPSCPGFDPKESDLVVSGHADARFSSPAGGVVLDEDVEVLASAAAVKTDFQRTIRPQFPPCLAYQLDHSANVVSATVQRIPFPATGSISAAYRARVVVRNAKVKGTLLSDFVFFAKGRIEYSFNVLAPPEAASQLVRFELALAEIVLKRAGALPA
jgi:hypothetical protein